MLSLSAHGQVVANWTGNGHNSLWTDANNWDTHAVPGANGLNDAAVINLQGSNFVLLNTNLTIGSVSLGGGQGTNILNVAGGSIQFAQALSVATNGIFQIQSNLTLTGTNFQNSGTIEVPAELGAVSFANNCNFTNFGTIDVETNSILNVVTPNLSAPGTSAFESGTILTGPGTVTFDSNASANFGGTITVDGTVVLNYSVTAANVIWTGSGLLQFHAGYMTNVTFAPGFNVQILVSDYEYLDGPCTNKGTIRVLSTGYIYAPNGGQFYNAGLFQIETNCDLSLAGFIGNPSSPIFQNTGIIKIPAGLGNLWMTNNCAFTNYGVIDVESNSALSFVNSLQSPFALESGTVFAGTGTLELGPLAGPFSSDGVITVDGTVTFNSGLSGNAIWTGPGLLQIMAGGMENVTFAPGFNVQLVGNDSKTFDGTCTNAGTIRVLGTGEWVADPAPYDTSFFYNTGLLQIETNFDAEALLGFQNTGTIRIPAQLGVLSLTMDCPFTNYGTIDVESNSIVDFASGVDDPPPFQFESGTVFDGAGTFQFVNYPAISSDGLITVDGILVFGGVQDGDATWTGSGLLQFTVGAMTDVTFAPGFNVQITGPDSKTFEGACTNEGTMRMLGTGVLTADPPPFDSSFFYNNGLIQFETNCGLENLLGFQNTGTIKIPAGLGSLSLTMDCPFTNYGVIDVETNSYLSLVTSLDSPDATFVFESGTVFGGTGTVELQSDNYLHSDGIHTVDGTVIINNTLMDGNAIWTGPGLLRFTGVGGDGIANVTFAPGFNVQLVGPVGFFGACTNEGTIRVLGTANIATVYAPPLYNNSAFYNSGLIQIETNSGFYGGETGFQNTGTIRTPPGLGALELTIECAFTNSSVIDVETNSELTISNDMYGSQVYEDGTTFGGTGSISLQDNAGSAIDCNGAIMDNCSLNLQSDMSGASTWTGSGRFSWLSGAISNINFAQGFHAQISGPNAKFIAGVCTNQGTVCWLGGGQLNDSMTSGQFYNSGTLQITADGTWNNIRSTTRPAALSVNSRERSQFHRLPTWAQFSRSAAS